MPFVTWEILGRGAERGRLVAPQRVGGFCSRRRRRVFGKFWVVYEGGGGEGSGEGGRLVGLGLPLRISYSN